jgi:hypothetical protein
MQNSKNLTIELSIADLQIRNLRAMTLLISWIQLESFEHPRLVKDEKSMNKSWVKIR